MLSFSPYIELPYQGDLTVYYIYGDIPYFGTAKLLPANMFYSIGDWSSLPSIDGSLNRCNLWSSTDGADDDNTFSHDIWILTFLRIFLPYGHWRATGLWYSLSISWESVSRALLYLAAIDYTTPVASK